MSLDILNMSFSIKIVANPRNKMKLQTIIDNFFKIITFKKNFEKHDNSEHKVVVR
jgi:hypothetical protein